MPPAQDPASAAPAADEQGGAAAAAAEPAGGAELLDEPGPAMCYGAAQDKGMQGWEAPGSEQDVVCTRHAQLCACYHTLAQLLLSPCVGLQM